MQKIKEKMTKKIKFYNYCQGLLHPPLDLFFIYKLEEMGYQVIKVRSIKIRDETLYFLTFPDINAEFLPLNYIVYNFEYNMKEKYIDILKNAKEVWDYSTYNIGKYNLQKHIFVPFIPTLYTSIKEKMKEYINEKSIDFLFYGCKNDRREKILQRINKNVEVYGHSWNKAIYNEELFSLLGKTKYVINLHFYEENILEIYRFFECLLCNVTVITEKGHIEDVYIQNLPNLIIVDDVASYINSL
jgi:hypothetical protein